MTVRHEPESRCYYCCFGDENGQRCCSADYGPCCNEED